MARFITLEGGEGVGKSTQRRMLEEALPRLYPRERFDFTHEPGGTPRADEIRADILSEKRKRAGGQEMFELFVEARLDHVANRIGPNLADGVHVICDRYFGSTYVYQHKAMEDPISIETFFAHAARLRKLGAFPDLIVVLDAPVEVTQARVAARKAQKATHFDTRRTEFHRRLRDGYLSFAELYREHMLVVDATKTAEEMHAIIMDRISTLLGS